MLARMARQSVASLDSNLEVDFIDMMRLQGAITAELTDWSQTPSASFFAVAADTS
jgi:hypothetical protein